MPGCGRNPIFFDTLRVAVASSRSCADLGLREPCGAGGGAGHQRRNDGLQVRSLRKRTSVAVLTSDHMWKCPRATRGHLG
jgi:hypothetical protein